METLNLTKQEYVDLRRVVDFATWYAEDGMSPLYACKAINTHLDEISDEEVYKRAYRSQAHAMDTLRLAVGLPRHTTWLYDYNEAIPDKELDESIDASAHHPIVHKPWAAELLERVKDTLAAYGKDIDNVLTDKQKEQFAEDMKQLSILLRIINMGYDRCSDGPEDNEDDEIEQMDATKLIAITRGDIVDLIHKGKPISGEVLHVDCWIGGHAWHFGFQLKDTEGITKHFSWDYEAHGSKILRVNGQKWAGLGSTCLYPDLFDQLLETLD